MKPVEIIEVGPRDGLQNEKALFSTEAKLELIERAINAGVRRIEVASFVHPKLIPQMADAEAVVEGLPSRKGVTHIGLVLNERGYDRALAARDAGGALSEVGAVAVATDTFGQKNQGQTIDESIDVASRIIRRAKDDGMSAQATISVCFGCPFEGEVPPERVAEIAARLAEAGPREIAIADTIGVGVPARVTELISLVREQVGDFPLRTHFHNTRNTGIANAWAAYEVGIRIMDSSLAGLGGCPFAPKATGNIATEDLIYMLDRSGIETGLDLDRLVKSANWVGEQLGRKVPSMLSQAGGFPGKSQ